MAISILMTALSPTMQDGVIAEWLVAEGQTVKAGDALCEIETDKATMPYESPRAGTILKIIAPAGHKAAVGETIAVLGKPGEDWQAIVDKAQAASTAAPAVPQPPAAPLPTLSTQSAFPALGPSAHPPAIPVQVFSIQNADPAPAIPGTQTSQTYTDHPALPSGQPPSSPLARATAREHRLDLRGVRGSGPHGRVVQRDVLAAASNAQAAVPATMPATHMIPTQGSMAPRNDEAAAISRPARGALRSGLRDKRVPLSKMRSIIAERLGASWTQAPHFFVRAAVDMERLLELRAAVNEDRERPVSLNAFVMRITAAALERHPGINASWEGDAIRYRPAADIGLAVALDGGLITPVVRACERKGVEQIDAELADLVPRARAGTLFPAEYSEASFTISNLGSSGVEEFTAIINPPGSAILALGAVSKEAVVRGDAIVARRTMRITLSSDHRVIDGAAAAAFVGELKALLEEPARALL